jgi:hypothetical protein
MTTDNVQNYDSYIVYEVDKSWMPLCYLLCSDLSLPWKHVQQWHPLLN